MHTDRKMLSKKFNSKTTNVVISSRTLADSHGVPTSPLGKAPTCGILRRNPARPSATSPRPRTDRVTLTPLPPTCREAPGDLLQGTCPRKQTLRRKAGDGEAGGRGTSTSRPRTHTPIGQTTPAIPGSEPLQRGSGNWPRGQTAAPLPFL